MNLDNLQIGYTYKNYKELCSILDEKVLAGNSKKSQMKEWERYFKYERDGYKLFIAEIYYTPLDKVDGRLDGGNKLPFISELEMLLIDLLLSHDKQMIMSNSKLLLNLCLINPNYYDFFRDREKLSEMIDMELDYIIDFYDVTKSTFKSAINTVTKRLEGKKLLIHELVMMVQFVDTTIQVTPTGHAKLKDVIDYDTNTDTYISKNIKPKEITREATATERELIIGIENDIMINQFKVTNIQDLYSNGKINSYYNEVSKVLFSELNIKKAYKAHRYTTLPEALQKEKLRRLDEWELLELQQELNIKVMVDIDKKSNKRQSDAYESIYNGIENKKTSIHVQDEYVDNINFISGTLIDKNGIDTLTYTDSESITHDMDLLDKLPF